MNEKLATTFQTGQVSK